MHPSEASITDFQWRLSMAPVIEDGIFSSFDEYARTLVLIDGKGLRLEHDNGQYDELNQPLDIARFQGAWQTKATLTDGPILDFNIMTQIGSWTSAVSVLDTNTWTSLTHDADSFAGYATDHPIQFRDDAGATLELPPGCLIFSDTFRTQNWQCLGSQLIAIKLIRS